MSRRSSIPGLRDEIFRFIADDQEIPFKILLGKRDYPCPLLRGMAYHILRSSYGYTDSELSRYFSYDRTTILHLRVEFEDILKSKVAGYGRIISCYDRWCLHCRSTECSYEEQNADVAD